MACEYNNIVNNIENILSKLSTNQKEREEVKPLIKWLNEAKVIGEFNKNYDNTSILPKQNIKESSTYVNAVKGNDIKELKTTIRPFVNGIEIVSNIPVERLLTSTKKVDKNYKVVINTAISSIKVIRGDELNHKDSLNTKVKYVYENSKDNNLIELLKNVFDKDMVVISHFKSMQGYKNRMEKQTINKWNMLAKEYFNSLVVLEESKNQLLEYLKTNYGIEYTKNQAETESLKTGVTEDLYYEYTINNAYINSHNIEQELESGTVAPKQEDSIIYTNDILKAVKKCAKG